MRRRGAALGVSAATGISAAVTVANRVGDVPLATLASSPQAVGAGKVWLVVTSALVADRPAVPSLVGFWIVGIAAVALLSVRAVAGVAAAGHVVSALAVYGVVGAVRAVDPHAFASVERLADYGLSAIIAAWLGAIACAAWVRYRSAAAHVAVVLGSLGCAGIGLAFRPDVTFLDTEHLVAFGLGVWLVTPALRRRLAPPRRHTLRWRVLTRVASGTTVIR